MASLNQRPITQYDIEKMRKDPNSLLNALEKLEEQLKEEREEARSKILFYENQMALKEKLDALVELFENQKIVSKNYNNYVTSVKEQEQKNIQKQDEESFNQWLETLKELKELQERFQERMNMCIANLQMQFLKWDKFHEDHADKVVNALRPAQPIMIDGEEFKLSDESLTTLKSSLMSSIYSAKMREMLASEFPADFPQCVAKAHAANTEFHVRDAIAKDLMRPHNTHIVNSMTARGHNMEDTVTQIYNCFNLESFLKESQHEAEETLKGIGNAAKEFVDTAEECVEGTVHLLKDAAEGLNKYVIDKPVEAICSWGRDLKSQIDDLFSAFNPFQHEEHRHGFRP